MNTVFLLMARHKARVVIPLEEVCRDYFPHLTVPKLLRKVSSGEIKLPILRAEKSQKSAKGVHIQHLAEYIDKGREEAERELRALIG